MTCCCDTQTSSSEPSTRYTLPVNESARSTRIVEWGHFAKSCLTLFDLATFPSHTHIHHHHVCVTVLMKSSPIAICLTLVLSLGAISAAWSADLKKGLAAAQSGDYATALPASTSTSDARGVVGQSNNLAQAVTLSHKKARHIGRAST